MDTSDNHEDIYWALVEQFIDAANNACDKADAGLVSAALLNATARFNAFVVASSSLDAKEFTEDIDGTTNYLTGRYRDFLKEHMDDYREHYGEQIRRSETRDH